MASVEADDWREGLSLHQRQQFILDGQYGSDVNFLVGKGDKKEVIKAHKFPLIAGSAVFEAMVDRWTVDSCEPIIITDTEPSTFRSMLGFLYSEAIALTENNVISLLYLSKKYLIYQLTRLCVECLQKQINIDNVCAIFDATILYNEAELSQKCAECISMNAEVVLTSKRFRQLRNESLVEILKCNDWQGVSEVEIFKACMEWADDQCGRDGKAVNDENRRAALGEALYQIRFPAMINQEFADATNDSQVLTGCEKVGLYEHIALHGNRTPTCSCKLKFNMTPRVVKVTMVTVSRFSQSGVQDGWPALGQIHAIDFVCNKQATLKGVGLYTTAGGNRAYATVQLINQYGHVINSISEKTLTTMGVPSPERVDFTNGAVVTAGVRYTITTLLLEFVSWKQDLNRRAYYDQINRSTTTYYGSQGVATVRNGYFTVTFHNSRKDQVGNHANLGQIPQLYFDV